MPDLRGHNRSRNQRRSILAPAPGLEAAEVLFDTIGDVLFCLKTACAARSTPMSPSSARPASCYEEQDDEVINEGSTIRDRLEMIAQPGGSVGWFVSQKVAVKSSTGEVIPWQAFRGIWPFRPRRAVNWASW